MNFVIVAMIVMFLSYASAQTLSTPTNVAWTGPSGLFSMLDGYGKGTRGGLNESSNNDINKGTIYYVTSAADNLGTAADPVQPGTLRYGIELERPGKPLWIKFGAPLAGTTFTITLKKTLRIERDNLTLDGRDATATILADTIWSNYTLIQRYYPNGDPYPRRECIEIDSATPTPMLILIKDRRNIIITNFTFTRGHYHNPLWGDENIDKQCLGDMISINNSVSATTANAVTKVWINKSSFANCGDECIGITRPVLNASQLFSISYSRFTMTDKTMILGGDLASDSTESNVKYIPYGERPYRISLYRSYFRETTQRNPRTMSAILHIYNNIFSDWDAYLVYNAPNETTGEVKSRVFMEENLFHLTLAANNIAENPNVHTGLFLYNNRATSFFTPIDNTDYGSGYPAFRDDWISPVYFNITAATLLTPTGIISKAGNVPQ